MPDRLTGEGCSAVLPLRTGRLILRLPSPDDVADVVRLAGDPDVALVTGDIPYPLTVGTIRAWLDLVRVTHAEGTGIMLAITEAGTGAVVGTLALVWRHCWPEAELGYWIGTPFWGRGYASEAVRAVIDLGFETFDLAAVISAARDDNPASVRVLEKAGLQPDGQRMAASAPARGGAVWDLTRRSLTRSAWETDRAVRSRILLVVAAALVDVDGRVLLTQRPEGKPMAGLWEFPGGKINEGETPERALIRELHEELGIDVRGSCLAPLAFASHAYADFHLLMPLYVLRSWRGEVTPKEGQDLAWVHAARLRDYPMPPADPPLIPALQDLLG